MATRPIAEGSYTSTIYRLISEHNYTEARVVLEGVSERFPENRASQSLLAYVTYQLQDFATSARVYGILCKRYSTVTEYRFNYAQSLYKSERYEEAMQVCMAIKDAVYNSKVSKLKALIQYELDENSHTRALLESLSEDPEALVLQACILVKEKKYEEALKLFSDALLLLGNHPYIEYNIALCHFYLEQHSLARKFILQIIERGIQEHPELSSYAPDPMPKSVGNTQTLKESALIEAFNLKAAIDFLSQSPDVAKESLQAMPPRNEDEEDPITLHNKALIHMDENPRENFLKMEHVVNLLPSMPDVFGNLLLLNCQYGRYSDAQELLNGTTFRRDQLDPELVQFLDALLAQETSPQESFSKLEVLGTKHTEALRKLSKQVQTARLHRDTAEVRAATKACEVESAKYIPVLMHQAKIFWDLNDYTTVEKILRQAVEYCSESQVWKLNMAHTHFVQENKFNDAIQYYEPIVNAHSESLLSVPAIVLANLCVSYIMTEHTKIAEELMRRIEREEEIAIEKVPNQKILSLCIVNLVIGTLYCSKGNFEYGIARIMGALDNFQRKLDTDTWFYAKLCFLALSEVLSKNMMILKDSVYNDIFEFLRQCDIHGRNLSAEPEDPTRSDKPRTISYEARMILRLLLRLRSS
ncbi:tetratricopeptide repeat protein 30A [Pelomyxa schiedti]|nr:tetratricopeptide repeat protein 30A [Pelomyxa schiedti]